MARFSSGLQSMKFMQRGRQRDDAAKKEEENEDRWVSSMIPSSSGRCVVIVEGDPKPSVTIGRMSFKDYNPDIDKMHEGIQTRKAETKSKAAAAAAAAATAAAASTSEVRRTEGETNDGLKVTNDGLTVKAESLTAVEISKEKRVHPAQKKQKIEVCKTENRFEALRAAQGFRKPSKF